MIRGTLSLLLLLAPSWALAEPVRAAYELDWKGLTIAKVTAELSEADGGYRLAWRGQTSGFLGVVYPFESSAVSEGQKVEDGLAPRLYGGWSLRGDEARAWAVDFGGDGRAVRVEIPEDDRHDREPVPTEMQVGPDPLSLALLALGRAGPGVQQTGMAFDGRQAFHLAAACAERTGPQGEIGDALLCTVEGRLLAGASRRWRDRGLPPEERPPAQVWLARDVVTAGWWPVRVEATTRWGVVTMRLVPAEATSPAG